MFGFAAKKSSILIGDGYGFPIKKDKWSIPITYKSTVTTGAIASYATIAPFVGGSLTAPIGEWDTTIQGHVTNTAGSAAYLASLVGLSTATNLFSDMDANCCTPITTTASAENDGPIFRKFPISAVAATAYYLVGQPIINNTTIVLSRPSNSFQVILENSYL